MPGRCRPTEEEWHRKFIERLPEAVHAASACGETIDSVAHRLCPTIGYEALICTAGYLVSKQAAFADAYREEGMAAEEWALAECALIEQAVEAVIAQSGFQAQLPMRYYGESLLLRTLEAKATGLSPQSAQQVLGQRLIGAWQKLLQSNAVPKQRVNEMEKRLAQNAEKTAAMMRAQVAEKGLKRCALDGCAAKEVHVSQFSKCAACKAVVYCCREHQVADWQSHKKACKAARKAAQP